LPEDAVDRRDDALRLAGDVVPGEPEHGPACGHQLVLKGAVVAEGGERRVGLIAVDSMARSSSG
jgi:hypothetical protein